MSSMDESRYFLFGVPSGMDDETMKKALCKFTGDPWSIRAIHWLQPAVDESVGGVVRLEIDEKTADMLKIFQEQLILGNKRAIFVDRKEISLASASVIDDDVVQLVKEKLKEEGGNAGKKWKSIVGKLMMTKYKNEKGYDCFRVRGPFSELIRFNEEIRKVLFKGKYAKDVIKGQII